MISRLAFLMCLILLTFSTVSNSAEYRRPLTWSCNWPLLFASGMHGLCSIDVVRRTVSVVKNGDVSVIAPSCMSGGTAVSELKAIEFLSEKDHWRSMWSANEDWKVYNLEWTDDGAFLGALTYTSVEVLSSSGARRLAIRSVNNVSSDEPPIAYDISWRPCSHLLAVGGFGVLYTVNPITLRRVNLLKVAGQSFEALSWDRDGDRLAAATNSGTIYVIKIRPRRVCQFSSHQQTVATIAWNRTSNLLAAVGDHLTILTANGSLTRKLSVRSSDGDDAVWNPVLNLLAFVRDYPCNQSISEIDLYDPKANRMKRALTCRGETSELAWSRDGKALAAWAPGGFLCVWRFDGNRVHRSTYSID